MKTKIILNSLAGRGRAKRVIAVIRDIFEDRKIALEMDITQSQGEATSLATEAVKNGFKLIVAAGGDGTINEVVNGIVGTRAIFGVIPIGLGNDFAKGIGVAPKLEDACRVLYEGAVCEIDVGRINSRYFINGVGIGFDAYVARESQNIRKFLNPDWIYLYTVLSSLFKYKSPKLKISFNNTTLDKKALLIAVGNGKAAGGGFLLTPSAEFDDGLMDVCIIDDQNRLKLLRDLPKAIKGEHVNLPYVKTFKTKEIVVSSTSLLLAHADGEILESGEYKLKILPRALRIMLPK